MSWQDEKWDVVGRYQNDAQFHELVDMMRAHLERSQFTPTEIREAALLAATMYENTHIRPLFVAKGRLG